MRVGCWGSGGSDMVMVVGVGHFVGGGDRLYGYRARLLEQLEEAGWLPVARVEAG